MHQKMESKEIFPGSKALGLSCLSSGGGTRELWLSREVVGKTQKLRVTPAGLSRYKLWAEGCQDVYPVQAFSVSPRPLLFRLEITESWLGSPLQFGRQGNKCLSYPSYT